MSEKLKKWIVDLASERPELVLTCEGVSKEVGIPNKSAERILESLVNDGRLQRKNVGESIVYVFSEQDKNVSDDGLSMFDEYAKDLSEYYNPLY